MSGSGDARRGGFGARMVVATMLAGGLTITGSVAQADNEPAPEGQESTGSEAVEGDGQGEQQAEPPAEDPAPAAPPSSMNSVPVEGGGGFGTNGAAAGDAGFAELPADPAYPVPAPPVNEDLPAQVDAVTSYQPQVSCDPVDRPGVTAFAMLLTEHYGRSAYSGSRSCIDYMSYHHDGRGLDWPLNAYDAHDRRIGDATVAWLTENDGEMMRRFGIEYIIWNELIFQKADNRWRYYTGSPHTDHVHFSFTWDGAQMRTSWWTGVAVVRPDLGPCAPVGQEYAALHTFPRLDACEDPSLAAPQAGLGRVRPGESGGGVSMLQEVLGIPTSGTLDEGTREALLAWQDEQGIPTTGVADAFTYAVAQGAEIGDLPASVLAVAPQEWQQTVFTPYARTTLTEGDQGEAVTVLQEALGAEPDGDFGPKTAAALAEWEESEPILAAQAERRGDGPAEVTPLTWLYLERAVHPTIALRDIELTEGSLDIEADPDGRLAARASAEGEADSPYAGGAVSRVQELLGVEADGSYGPMTAEAVRAVQEAAELEPTGEVDGPTWAALEAYAIEEGLLDGAPGTAEQQARAKAEKEAAEEKAAEEKAAAEKKAAEKKAAEKAEQERAEQEARERFAASLADASR